MPRHFDIQIVSPHQDDAAFSLGIVLSSLALMVQPVTIVNCFTRSAYAPFGSSQDPEIVAAQRAEEDAAVAARLGNSVAFLNLGLLDAPLRLGIPVGRVCDLHEWDESSLVSELAVKLAAANRPKVVLVPHAIGNHVDHRLAKSAALKAFPNTPMGFYEDLPYVARDGAATPRYELPLAPYIHQAEYGLAAKRSLVSCYKSQIDPPGIESIISFAERCGWGERLWLTDAARDVLLDAGLTLS